MMTSDRETLIFMRSLHGESWGTCPRCVGEGTVACHRCGGDGQEQCSECYGLGDVEESCPRCDHTHSCECSVCHGGGRMDCTECDGFAREGCGACKGTRLAELAREAAPCTKTLPLFAEARP